jgi:hypothetical protein
MPPRWKRQLATLGWRVVQGSASEQVALVRVEQSTREAARRGSGLSIGIGGGSYGRNVGVGGGLTLPIGGARGGQIVVTDLGRAAAAPLGRHRHLGRPRAGRGGGGHTGGRNVPPWWTGSRPHCFKASQENRAALSASHDPFHHQPP